MTRKEATAILHKNGWTLRRLVSPGQQSRRPVGWQVLDAQGNPIGSAQLIVDAVACAVRSN
jgi:hypothetical protein